MSTFSLASSDTGTGTELLAPLGTPTDPDGVTTQWGVVNRGPLTRAVQTLLQYGTGRPVGIHRAPIVEGDANLTPPVPYLILYPLPGGMSTGTYFVHPESDVRIDFQVTSVATDDEQVEWMADRARQTMIGRTATGAFVVPLAVNGLAVMDRETLMAVGGMDRRDNIYSVSESYAIWVSTEVSQ